MLRRLWRLEVRLSIPGRLECQDGRILILGSSFSAKITMMHTV